MKERVINAKLQGDDAKQVDVMLAALSFEGTKKECDSQLIALALLSLEKAIDDCKKATGKKFPSTDDVQNFLAKTGGQFNLS